MKPVYVVAGFFLCAALRAQAPERQAARLPGEPHHHLELENSYVRAYSVEVAAHDSTLLHQHDHDYIYVSLGPADVINAVRGKPELHQMLKDGELHFLRGGFAHVARNLSDAPFRNITIEFLHAQGEVRNLCEKIIEAPLGECQKFNGGTVSSEPWFETDELRVDFAQLGPKANFGGTARIDNLLVALDQAELEVDSPGKPAVRLVSGDVLWLPGGTAQSFINLKNDAPSRFLLLSFKDSAASPPAPKP